MEIVTFTNKFDPMLTDFRRQVCMESGCDEAYFDLNIKYLDTIKRFETKEDINIEEIYKFGQNKWSSTNFLEIEAVVLDRKVICMSGSASYRGGMVRVGMHHYTLKKFRKLYRQLMFKEKGLFSRHVVKARKNHKSCVFFSVYAHNSSLLYYVKNLRTRRFSPEGRRLFFLSDLLGLEDEVLFNGVKQSIFYYPLCDGFKFNIEDLRC